MDEFLETYNLPRLNHMEKENLNRPVTSREIESVVKIISTKKIPGPDGSLVNSTKHFKKKTPILLKRLQKN